MARKDKDSLYSDFLADLKSIVGDDGWTTVEEKLFKNEKAATKIKESVLARADYSSSMDALREERTKMEGFLAQEREKIDGWQRWYGETSAQFAGTADELKRYREEFGDLEPSDQRREAKKVGMTAEDFEKRLSEEINKRDTAALRFVDDLTDLKIDHRSKFGETLNTEELYKLAGEKGLPLKPAYKEYVADRVEAQRKKDFDDALVKARDEGAREALSKHNLPHVSSIPALTHVLDVKDAPNNHRDRVAAAMKDFSDRTSR